MTIAPDCEDRKPLLIQKEDREREEEEEEEDPWMCDDQSMDLCCSLAMVCAHTLRLCGLCCILCEILHN